MTTNTYITINNFIVWPVDRNISSVGCDQNYPGLTTIYNRLQNVIEGFLKHWTPQHFGGLVQECGISSALALEIP